MKRALFALVLCACSSTHPRSVEIAAPLASASVAPARIDFQIPAGAKRLVVKDNGSWVAEFPKSKTFVSYDLPDAKRVLFTWQIGAYHVAKPLPPDEDYPGNHVARIDLAVQTESGSHVIAFGELAGSVAPYGLSFCAPEDPNGRRPRAFVSTFSIGIPQGDDDMAIVADARSDGTTLHVLHRETSDGKCDEKMQGPLDVCDGFEWQRVAAVRVPSGVELYELVTAEQKPFACDPE